MRPLPSTNGWSYASQKCTMMARTTGWDEAARGFPVGKGTHGRHPVRQLVRRGRVVEHISVVVADDADLVRSAKTASRRWVVEGFLSHEPVNLEHQLRRKGGRPQLPDTPHRGIVVQDHLLARVAGLPARANHLFGHFARGRRALELAGRDGLLDQRTHEVPVAGLRVGDGFRDAHQSACAHIHLVKPLHYRFGDRELEVAAPPVAQVNCPQRIHPRELEQQPPLPMGPPLGRGAVPQFVPMEVLPRPRGGLPRGQQLREPLGGRRFSYDFIKVRGCLWYAHGLFANLLLIDAILVHRQ